MKTRNILIATGCLVAIGAAAFSLTRKSKEERVAELLERARRFEEQDDPQSALISLRNALKLMPARADIHVRLARNYGRLDRPHDSLKHYDAALRQGVKDEDVLRDYAGTCLRYNALGELAKPAARILKLKPGDAHAHFWMARSLAAGDRPREAIVHAEEGLLNRPDKEAYLLLADLHARNNDYEAAERRLREALAKLPGNPELIAGLAAAEIELEREDEAREDAQRALAAVEGADTDTKIRVYAVTADVYRRLRMDARSIEVYRLLVELAPDNTRFRGALARRYLSVGRVEDATALLQESLHNRPEENHLRIVLAHALLMARKAEEAQAQLDKLPPDLAFLPYTLYVRGSALLALDDPWQAEPVLRRAADGDPDLLPARLALGICCWKMELLPSAEAEFQQVLNKVPGNVEATLWLARCKLAAGNLPAAEALARGALAVDEPNEQAREILILCAMQRGRIDEVERLLKITDRAQASAEDLVTAARTLAAKGHMERALAAVEAALEKEAGLPEATVLKARILELADKGDEAEALLRALAAGSPDSAAAAVEYAAFLARAGKGRMARDVLVSFTWRSPRSAVGHYALAELYDNQRSFDEAAASFAAARELEPKNMTFRRRLAQIFIEKKDFGRARAEVEQMRADFGETMEVLVLEGTLHLEKGDPDEAIACFTSASRRWPRQAEGQMLTGVALLRKDDIGAAIAAFEAARDLAPRDVRARVRLRDAYLLAGLYEKAAEEARQVIELRPDGAEDLHRFALSLAGSRKTRKARELLQRLSSTAPERAEYHVQLAMLLASEGKTQQAESEILKALNIERTAGTILAACDIYWRSGKPRAARELIESVAENDRRLYHSLLARHHAIAGETAKAEAELKEMIRLAPDDPAACCALGDFYAALPDRFDDAAEAYRQAVEIDPQFAYAQVRTAALLARAGRLKEAQRILEPLAERRPRDVSVRAALAEIAIGWLRLVRSRAVADAALRRCTEFARNFPHVARAHYLLALARSLAEPPDYGAVQAAIDRALALAPGFVEVRLLRARIYHDRGGFTKAEAECREVLNSDRAHIEAMLLLGDEMARRKAKPDEYEKLAEEFPGNAAAALLCGIALRGRDPERSARLINKALGQSPRWELLQAYARLLAAEGRADEAISKLRAFVRENPRFAEGHRALGEAHAAADDLAAAVSSQRRAYVLSGGSSADLRRAVALLVKAGADADAIAFAREHVTKRPQDTSARLLLARLLGKAGRLGEAVAELTRVLKEEPDNIQARLALGTAYLLEERYDDAAGQYDAVLVRDPSNHTAANNLAFILAEHSGRPREAEQVILPALRRFPDSATIQDTYGWVLYRVGRLKEAREALEKSLKLEPHQPLTVFHLAVVCKELQQTDRARRLLRRALDLDEAFEKADEARELLTDLE